MKIRINLASIWSTVAPIVVPIVVSAVTGALQKHGDRIVDKARGGAPAVPTESTGSS